MLVPARAGSSWCRGQARQSRSSTRRSSRALACSRCGSGRRARSSRSPAARLSERPGSWSRTAAPHGGRRSRAVTSACHTNRAARIREAGAKPALSRNCKRGATGQDATGQLRPGRRPAATMSHWRKPMALEIRKPGDLTERRTSPTCADRLGGLRRRGPLRQAGNAAGGTMRRLVVASAILASLLTTLTLPLAGVAAAPNALPVTAPTDPERAAAALSYLWAAQRPDGSLDKSLGETADFVIGAAAAGYDPATLQGCADAGARWTTSRPRPMRRRATRRRRARRSWRSSRPAVIRPVSPGAISRPGWRRSISPPQVRTATAPRSASRLRFWR